MPTDKAIPTMKPALPFTWEEHELSSGYSSIIYDANGTAVNIHLHRDVAKYVTRAVNAHDDAIAALRSFLDAYDGFSDHEILRRYDPATLSRIRKGRTAIAKAEGRA
jgi:hypothetical protein